MGNVENVLRADVKKGSEIIIASHNNETLDDVKEMHMKNPNPNLRVQYAQLLGLADHLTIQLLK